MQFMVRFDIKQPANVTNADLVAIWQREAAAALGAMEAGAVTNMWKVAGQRVVFVVLEMPSPEALDRALGGLPIVRELGPGVTTEAWPIYDYQVYAQDLNDGVHGP